MFAAREWMNDLFRKIVFWLEIYPKSNLSPHTINRFRMYKCKSIFENKNSFLENTDVQINKI